MNQKKWFLITLALVLFIPSFFIPYELTNIYVMYRQVQDGLNHLQAAANVFHGTSNDGFTHYLDATKLQQVQADIDAAHASFVSLDDRLAQDSLLGLASPFSPAQINSLRAVGRIADDGTAVAQQVLKTLRNIAPDIDAAVQNSSLSSDPPMLLPFLTPASYQEINTTLKNITPLIHRITLNAQNVSLTALPLSSKQRATLASILPLLPAVDGFLSQWSTLRDPLAWLLGINQQRSFLVEPMDSSELRATGGFTGQFGELVLNGAHPGPIKLANIGKYEEDHSDVGSPPDPIVYPKVVGQSAPVPYSEWWPIPNFGMRDANVSADFPTSAKIIMHSYNYEFGRTVDGVIVFTPTLIEQVLNITGPIPIQAYGQVVTAQNLENLLHFYQLNNEGIYQEMHVEKVRDPELARKLFTQRVTTALISAVSHLPTDKMLTLATGVLHSLKTKDLQIYVNNDQAENLIGTYGSTASIDRTNTHDSLFIVQDNLSASKASQYVTTTIQDTVNLDQQGGATHHLQMTLDYQQTGPVYGLDTYRDYVRVYVPENSQLITGNGFDQYDRPYCGDGQSGYNLCQSDVYGDGSLICATPIEIGEATSLIDDPYSGDHPLDMIGPPQNQQSDEPGKAMFGGWVVIPKNCTMTITLSWYVPPMSGQPYSLLIQAQAGVDSPLMLAVQPPAGTCAQQNGVPLRLFQTMNGEDTSFTIKHQRDQCSLVAA
ncbi:MAG TPA: DUF4012 domain-containing protein [Ktedonobacterales bacterium]|nr:DUF4012 domain-containing protein [Ktedonobacterales bacterium]